MQGKAIAWGANGGKKTCIQTNIYIYIYIILYNIGPERIQFKSTCIYVYVSFVPSVISSATAKGLDMADSNSQT